MTVNELIGVLCKFNGTEDVVIEVTALGKPVGHSDNYFLTPIDVESCNDAGAIIIAPMATRRDLH